MEDRLMFYMFMTAHALALGHQRWPLGCLLSLWVKACTRVTVVVSFKLLVAVFLQASTCCVNPVGASH